MTNVVGIEKSFPICEFPIPTLLNLLKGGVRNGGKIFNGGGRAWGVPPHPHPTSLPSLTYAKTNLSL